LAAHRRKPSRKRLAVFGSVRSFAFCAHHVSAIYRDEPTIWIADAHRGDGKRFIVRAYEKLTAFLELEAAILA
jgi:hypothetical protein